MKEKLLRFFFLISITVAAMMVMTSCAASSDSTAPSGEVSVSRKPGIPKTDEPKTPEGEETTVDTTELYIVQLLNTKKEKIFLKNLYTGREYVYRYSLMTDFLDKYGGDTNVTAFGPGRVVNITESGRDRTLETVRAANDVWTYDDIVKYEMASTQNEAEQFYEDLAISPDYLNYIIQEHAKYGPKGLTRDWKDFFLKNYEIEPIIQEIKSSFFIDYRTAIKLLIDSDWEYKFMFDSIEEVEQFYLDCVKKYDEQGMKKIKYLNGEPEPLDWSDTNLEYSKQYID